MSSIAEVRGNEEQLKITALFKGGGAAADCVIQTTSHKMVSGLKYNAATGTFNIVLTEWPGVLVGCDVGTAPTAGGVPHTATVDFANVSKTAFTVPVYFKAAATDTVAAAAVDPATTCYIQVELTFQKSA